MRRLRTVAAIAILATLALTSACSFADKRRTADKIRRAPDLLEQAGVATGELQLSIKIAASSQRSSGIQGARGGKIPPLTIPTVIDYRARRSATKLALAGTEQPFQLAVGTTLYQHTVSMSPGPSQQRKWRSLDLESLYEDRTRYSATAMGAQLVPPVTLIDLVRGALTGSVREDGTETIGGDRTTRYRMNVDLDKAFKRVPEERRRAFDVVREVTGMKRLVHPGRIWLDGRGLPRRVEISLREERSRRDAVELTYVLELKRAGGRISLPAKKEVAEVGDIAALNASIDPSIIAGASIATGGRTPAPPTTLLEVPEGTP